MKFIHMGDCHLGGWKQPELMALNLESFYYVINFAIKEKADFVLVAGDLFDSPYPPIEIIKEAFDGFRKLKDANIPVFLIAGSHDYSASGKTFLDVLEKGGLCKNVFSYEERNGKILLQPTIYKNVAIYGYPGKKSGLEVPEIEKIKLQDAPGLFRILMLHTSIRDAVGTLPIPAVDQNTLPKVDYTALAHLHIKYNKNNRVYCGPTFPNNSEELEELKGGSFYLVDTSGKAERKEIKLRDVEIFNIEINNAHSASEIIINQLKEKSLKGRIIILKLKGLIEVGKPSEINFKEIEDYAKSQEAYVVLKSTSRLNAYQSEIKLEAASEDMEDEIIKKYTEENQNEFSQLIEPLMHALHLEKKDDEKSKTFEDRLVSDVRRVIG